MRPRKKSAALALCAALAYVILFLNAQAAWAAQVCSTPGSDGPGSISGVINTYFPGAASAPSGATTITVGAAAAGGAQTPIAAGDLLLIIQMQDADIDSSNTSSYGSGGLYPGAGYTSLNSAGLYEYAVAAGPVPLTGGTLTLTAPLINSYHSAAYGAAGQRTFQVIRVPQYSSATLAGGLTAYPWDGSTGGVLAFDVAGQLNWNGQMINLTGYGFRGGAGKEMFGVGTGTGLQPTDYLTSSSLQVNSAKGEGIAGTPEFVFVPTTPGGNQNPAGSLLDTGVEGYPNGSMGRGAPGNAGGGGTDGDPPANDQNTGGGGGAGYGTGGSGGYAWDPTQPPPALGQPNAPWTTGGFGGIGIPMTPGLIAMGGGGGAGTSNNNTSWPGANGLGSSGAAGGGIVMIRAGSITGTGTINDNGATGYYDDINSNPSNTPSNDAAGGGGGGGSVLVYSAAGPVGSLTVNAQGGGGGSATGCTSTTYCVQHGPGGGGGGGYVALSGSASVNVSGGVHGTTVSSTNYGTDYGSTSGANGYWTSGLAANQIPGAGPTAACMPVLTATKAAVTPNAVQGGSATYTITVSNRAGAGGATGVSVSDVLPGSPSPFMYASTGNVALINGTTRPTTNNPAAGSATPAWSSFNIPGGSSVAITFIANVPAATTPGTYRNPANITFADPTRTSAGQTVFPGGTYAGGGTVGGSNYVPQPSPTPDACTIWKPVSISKSFNPGGIPAGGTSALSIILANPNPVAITNAVLTDTYPAQLVNSGNPSAAISGVGCSGTVAASAGGGGVGITNTTIPANGSCTVTVNVTTQADATYTNTIPSGAFSSDQNMSNIAAASATLLGSPQIALSFTPSAIAVNGTSMLSFNITNPNAGQALTLSNSAFTDSLPSGVVAEGGAVTVTGTGCTGFTPASIGAGAASFTLAGGTLPAGGSCTVSFAVTSGTAGMYTNSASGVSTAQTATGAPSNSAILAVGQSFTPPSIAAGFSPATIGAGSTSTLTFTLTNPNPITVTGAAYSDNLVNIQTGASGAAGGTCAGASGNTFNYGVSGPLSFSGISVPANGSCTVTIAVTSSNTGVNPNSAGGVTTDQTPTAGAGSAVADLTVINPPQVSVAFSPGTIMVNGASTLTITLTNANAGTNLANVSFADNLTNMQTVGGAAGGTCSGASGNSFSAGQTALLFSGITVNQNSSCTVIVNVTSSGISPASGFPDSTSGATSSQTPVAGPVSNTAYLNVLALPTITKSFSPGAIRTGNTSTITFTLTNPDSQALTNAGFTDTYPNNLQNTNPPNAITNCTGGTVTAAAGGGSVSLSGGTIPANGSCTVTVDVTSGQTGNYTNTSGGITSGETQGTGPASNAATLAVGRIGISKTFSPSIIGLGGTSTITFTLNNQSGGNRTNVRFTDNFPSGMTISSPVTTTNTCGGTLQNSGGGTLQSGNTDVRLYRGYMPNGGTCTITLQVTTNATGTYANTSTGVTAQNVNTGPPSNTAVLTVVNMPTISEAFSPAETGVNGVSTLAFTLTNPNGTALTNANFTDTLSGMNIASAVIGGTCPNASNSPALAVGATSLNLTVPNLLPGSCTVTVQVASSAAGNYTNGASGVTTDQTPAPGTASNAAALSVVGTSLIKTFSPASIQAGGSSVMTFTVANGSGNPAQNGLAFTETLPANVTIVSPVAASQCGGTVTSPGANTLTFSGGSISAGIANCTITANVTSSLSGTYHNASSNISGASAGMDTSQVNATLTVTALYPPEVSKSFAPAQISVNGTSVLTITLTNPNAFNIAGAAFTDTYPANMINTNTPNGITNCTGGTITAAANGSSLSLSGGTIPANSSCTVTVNVTSGTAGNYTNNTGPVTATNAGTGISASATLTVTSAGINIHGTVYNDANHNFMQDSGESGTGQTVYIKLAASSGGVCASTAISATPADPSTGQYTISGVSSGNYCLVISANSTLSITSPLYPAGWTGTEASSGVRTVAAGGPDINQQDFGLYYGTSISGEVFVDTGNGGGTPNDGRLNGQEAGLAGAVMKMTSDSGGTVYDSMSTGASGIYKLYIPGTVAPGTYIKIIEANPAGYISTGADPGNSGGVYDRPSDTIRFAVASGTVYNGVNFGDVPANQFITDGAQTGSPGTTLTYSHTYTAGSAGTLNFSTTAYASPSMSGWGEVLYQDTGCTGHFAAGDPQITAPISVSAGQKICILMKEFIPAQAPLNAQDKVTVTAQLSYLNANPALTDTQTRTDLTTVGTGVANGLNLSKTVDKTSVLPGSTITYTITYSNQSASVLTSIVINDATPAYTTFQSASCGVLGAGLTGCLASGPSVGAQGSISWTLSGGLAAGASGTVSFTVQVQP